MSGIFQHPNSIADLALENGSRIKETVRYSSHRRILRLTSYENKDIHGDSFPARSQDGMNLRNVISTGVELIRNDLI